jgi:DNA-directed RNA polymerase subunit RPC12/RpoP
LSLEVFLVQFLLFVGAGVVIGIIGRKAPRFPSAAKESQGELFASPMLILFASVFALLAWVFGAIVIIGVLVSVFEPVTLFLLTNALLMMLFGFLYLAASAFIKCTGCSKRVLFNSTLHTPPFSKTTYGLSGWSAVVIDVVRNRQFQCMYCGAKYVVRRKT